MQKITRSPPLDKFLARIDFYRAQVDLALFKELRERRESPFFAPFEDAFTGGKRLRPIIVLLAYESVGGRIGDPLPAAVAVELAHMESLIHDDIIDGDGIRRNAKSFHVKYGQEMALLSADFILSLILSIATRYSDPRIMGALAAATSQMCEGELAERVVSGTQKAVRPTVYGDIVLKKTASLFEAAATMGALIGGATPSELSALAAYARAVGIAYQIHDDIIDWMQSRQIMIELKDIHNSQKECLLETATSLVHEAIDSLRQLRSSEAKQYLIQLARRVDSQEIHQM